MALTGEKYTDARRALLASGGESGGAGGDPGATIAWPEDSLGWFTDQAYNLILLADDEARMLSHRRTTISRACSGSRLAWTWFRMAHGPDAVIASGEGGRALAHDQETSRLLAGVGVDLAGVTG